jgi:hypothetical protein
MHWWLTAFGATASHFEFARKLLVAPAAAAAAPGGKSSSASSLAALATPEGNAQLAVSLAAALCRGGRYAVGAVTLREGSCVFFGGMVGSTFFHDLFGVVVNTKNK